MPSGAKRLLAVLFATVLLSLETMLPALAASTIAGVRVDAQASGGATITITFSGGASPYHVVGAGTPETAIIFDGALVGQQIPPTVAGTGPVSSVSIAQTGTSSSVALHLTAAAGVRVRAAGGAVVVGVANPAGTSTPGLPPPAPSAVAAPGSNTENELVLLKYADVSEIAGVLVAGSSVATNDTFQPTQSNVGASSLGGNTIGGGGTGGFAPAVQQQQTFGNFGGAGGGGGLAQRLNDNVAIDRRLNAIILTGTPDVIDPLKAMIDRLDIPVPSVLLECEIVELSDTAARNIGLDFSPDGSGIVVNGSSASTSATTTTGSTSNGYTAHTQQEGSGGFSFGANLYAQITEGNGRVLSKPRILAQSGQQASILTGDAIPVFTSVTAANVGVSNQVNYINVGVNLQIAPRVSSDGIVTSHIFSDVSSVTGYIQNTPQISQRTTSTLASVRDGEAFVIGGLLQDNETRSLTKLPFIGDLPIIGPLFPTHKHDEATNQSLHRRNAAHHPAGSVFGRTATRRTAAQAGPAAPEFAAAGARFARAVNGRELALAGVLAAGVVSCAPNVPGIADPIRVDAHCSPREARITGIRSILTSTNDLLETARPTRAYVLDAIRTGDGAIAFWNDQLLALPKTSRALGETDGYARVRAAGIPPAPVGVAYRPLYLDVRDHGAYAWIQLQAFDVQDICIEGHKQS